MFAMDPQGLKHEVTERGHGMSEQYSDIKVTHDGYVSLIEICRPPHNYFDLTLIEQIASALESIDHGTDSRAVVLAAEGRSFCAGAQFNRPQPEGLEQETPPPGDRGGRLHLYREAARIFEAETPIVAAVQGAAIGGGLGLALAADFRVAAPDSMFTANFSRLGFHQGFGLTVTLPRIVGQQQAWRLLMTGMRIDGREAHRIGLADALVEDAGQLRERAFELATEIAAAGPLAVRAIRRTLRHGLADEVRIATTREQYEQDWLRQTSDFKEGVRATAERREPDFAGR